MFQNMPWILFVVAKGLLIQSLSPSGYCDGKSNHSKSMICRRKTVPFLTTVLTPWTLSSSYAVMIYNASLTGYTA